MRHEACLAVRGHTTGAPAVMADIGCLPFRSALFSQVYFLETLEHLTRADGLRVLGEIRRVSRPRARCLVTTPNYRSHWIGLEWLLDTLHLTPPLGGGQHVSRYDGASLATTVEAAGWRPLRVGTFNLLAPFAGLLSRAMAARAVDVEARYAGRTGALLYALCEAPE